MKDDFSRDIGEALAELPPEPVNRPRPERFVTISMSEYLYLNRIDAVMDVLLADNTYTNSTTVDAVKSAVQELRHSMATAEAVAME